MEAAEAAAREAEKAKLTTNKKRDDTRRGRRGGGRCRPIGSSSSSYSRQDVKAGKRGTLGSGKKQELIRGRNTNRRGRDEETDTQRIHTFKHHGGEKFEEYLFLQMIFKAIAKRMDKSEDCSRKQRFLAEDRMLNHHSHSRNYHHPSKEENMQMVLMDTQQRFRELLGVRQI